MKWEDLNLHIENLLPGIVSLFLIYSILPGNIARTIQEQIEAFKSEFIKDSVFLSFSYILGILIVAISRLAVDRLSERYPRPLLIRMFSRDKLDDTSSKGINKAYRSKINKALSEGSPEIKAEVLKRRERGRIARTTFFPVGLTAYILAGASANIFLSIAASLAASIVVIFIYAYIEYTTYEECSLAT